MHQKLRRPQRTSERYAAWRSRCLRNAGFDPSEASRIACDTACDLHALLELIDRGCRPDLAVRILAPLEREEAGR